MALRNLIARKAAGRRPPTEILGREAERDWALTVSLPAPGVALGVVGRGPQPVPPLLPKAQSVLGGQLIVGHR